MKYSKKPFEGYTHRFVVRFRVSEDSRDDSRIDIYSDSESYFNLENFINENKSKKVLSYTIEHRASKEQDDLDSEFINDVLKDL